MNPSHDMNTRHEQYLEENYDRILQKVPVYIPTPDGKSIAETIEEEVEVLKHKTTGEVVLDMKAMNKLDDIKARHMGLMLPADIKHLRESMGVTQGEISELLKIGEKTWSRWENGRGRPSQSMNVLLKILFDGKADINYLRFMNKPADRMKVSKHLLERKGRVHQTTYAVPESTPDLQPEFS